jgi:hypothetical protein
MWFSYVLDHTHVVLILLDTEEGLYAVILPADSGNLLGGKGASRI